MPLRPFALRDNARMTSSPLRRALLLAGLGVLTPGHAQVPQTQTPQTLRPRTLVFPRDHGSHPELQTEWWYVTGHVEAGGQTYGFQVTFFRSRVDGTQNMQSRFAAKQLLFAHAAVTDLQGKRLLHDQRLEREAFGLARADPDKMALEIKGWSLMSSGASNPASYQVRVQTEAQTGAFTLDLNLVPSQPVLLQGDRGLSRKGPLPEQASYYYSLPQLQAAGTLVLEGRRLQVAGRAWLDHEWSDALLHPQAVGWDWIGMNLKDGSALTAFQLRDKEGKPLWDGGSFRSNKGLLFIFKQGEVVFSRQKSWKSPQSQANYPVEWIVRTPADFYTVKALIPNQELDSRRSTGTIYWEGLSDLMDSNGQHVGRGYLEMTGYAKPLRLS